MEFLSKSISDISACTFGMTVNTCGLQFWVFTWTSYTKTAGIMFQSTFLCSACPLGFYHNCVYAHILCGWDSILSGILQCVIPVVEQLIFIKCSFLFIFGDMTFWNLVILKNVEQQVLLSLCSVLVITTLYLFVTRVKNISSVLKSNEKLTNKTIVFFILFLAGCRTSLAIFSCFPLHAAWITFSNRHDLAPVAGHRTTGAMNCDLFKEA